MYSLHGYQRIVIVAVAAIITVVINPTSASCDIYKSDGNIVPPSVLSKWNMWPNLIGDNDIKSGVTLGGFEYTMDAIWEHQHPEDCSNAKYYISTGATSGFGAEIHIEAGHLARALDMGRVLILRPQKDPGPNGYDYLTNDFCKAQNKTNMECYYQPWTHCTWEDALGGKLLEELPHHIPNTRKPEDLLEIDDRSIVVKSLYSPHVPNLFEELLTCIGSSKNKDMKEDWWYAMATSFLMRPNEQLLKRFDQHRADPTLQFDQNKERCISVKIRKGDKHKEMQLVDDDNEFFEAAALAFEELKAAGDTIALSQKQPVMFVESEDPDAMESAKKWTQVHGWSMRYAEMYDKRTGSDGWMNYKQIHAAMRNGTFFRNPDEYFQIVLTIDYHLRCSAFICSIASNACRIINELRKTVAGKANRSLLDVRPCHPGQTAPCYKQY